MVSRFLRLYLSRIPTMGTTKRAINAEQVREIAGAAPIGSTLHPVCHYLELISKTIW